MIKIVGVRFRTAGKIYYFDPKKLPIKKGDHVIVETARGDRKSTRLNSSHKHRSRMPSSA